MDLLGPQEHPENRLPALMLVATGELLIFIATFGKHRPNWHLDPEYSSARRLSFWVGLAFWLVIVWLPFGGPAYLRRILWTVWVTIAGRNPATS